MNHPNSVQTQVEQQLDRLSPGVIIFPGDFLEAGSPEAVHMALSRMAKNKQVTRLGKGIYQKPKTDPELGLLRPPLEEIAKNIAEKEHIRIRPTGSYALNKLGLSTQVPTKAVFLTDGNTRKIQVGRATIVFKKTTPKKLAVTDDTVFLVIQALIELKDEASSPQINKRLLSALAGIKPETIRKNARLAPHSVARILYQLANQLESHG